MSAHDGLAPDRGVGGLRQAVVRGTAWSALSTVCNRGLRFLMTILLARLLMPADFGLIAMTTLAMDVAQLLRDLGLGAALIQRKQLDPEHLTTCFWTNQAMGLLLWAATSALAPAVAAFYGNPLIEPLLRVMAISFVISPIGSVPWMLLNRRLQFKELMIAESVGTFARSLVALTLAWQGAGVWSLVWGPLAGTVIGTIMNWRLCEWRPRLSWSQQHFLDLFRFGRSVFGEKVLGYFSANSDYLVVGRLLGAQTLGFYNFAYQLPHLAETHLVPVLGRVLFPVFSQVQADGERLRRGYLHSLRWVAAVAIPFGVGLLISAPELVPIVYGARWQPVVAPLQILCFAGIAHALTNPVWSLQQAVGRPDIGFWWNAATVPAIILVLVVVARWGMVSVAVTMLILGSLQSAVIQHITNRLIRLSWSRWLKAVRVPALAAAGMGLAAGGARSILLAAGWSLASTLAAVVAVGILSYALLCLWQDRSVAEELWRLIRREPSAGAPAAGSQGPAGVRVEVAP